MMLDSCEGGKLQYCINLHFEHSFTLKGFVLLCQTKNEHTLLVYSFYTCLKHQLMHQLYSSDPP